MIRKIWKKMRKKAYRDAFVQAQISDTVAAQISSLRNARGWKQTELAEKAGMKQSRISALEDPNHGNFEIETLRKLASAFDVGLVVRFVPFSEIAKWSASVSPATLAASSFAEDEFAGHKSTDDTVTIDHLSVNQNDTISVEVTAASVWQSTVRTPTENVEA
jgi:transcriptional regulator with XRE-family HTH domain